MPHPPVRVPVSVLRRTFFLAVLPVLALGFTACDWFAPTGTPPNDIQVGGALIVGTAMGSSGTPWTGAEVLAYAFPQDQCASDPTVTPKGGEFVSTAGIYRITAIDVVLQNTEKCMIVRFRGTDAGVVRDTFVIAGNVEFRIGAGVESDLDSLVVDMVLP